MSSIWITLINNLLKILFDILHVNAFCQEFVFMIILMK